MANIKKGENKFFVGDKEEDPLAEITFESEGSTKLVVDHTYVSEELRGEGVAQALVERMVSFAREEKKEIIPQCSYTKKQMDKHPEYQDVLSTQE
ncbi:N-acetyltransferase [Salicibibacter cibarius]|uniref:N-acetyltransferase n=1 Tax=Salicibibacter cibarius TaxID=2743000 RepID=A0A7T6Z182_9BACI|nr:GNAT family N-acetyltransferase [Salicibibacter cibarius]QQK75007.1 N-acetyltransferase [Salicibibacter cibarius]